MSYGLNRTRRDVAIVEAKKCDGFTMENNINSSGGQWRRMPSVVGVVNGRMEGPRVTFRRLECKRKVWFYSELLLGPELWWDEERQISLQLNIMMSTYICVVTVVIFVSGHRLQNNSNESRLKYCDCVCLFNTWFHRQELDGKSSASNCAFRDSRNYQ